MPTYNQKGVRMTFSIFELATMIMLVILLIGVIAGLAYIAIINQRMKNIMQNITHQNAVLIKLQSSLKSRHATNVVAENAEMLYQDMLQHIIPIMAALNIMPRNSDEHSLWRALGGIMDEYAKNPFVLEQLRRSIKLDSNISRCVDMYVARAEKLLSQISLADSESVLATAFADGLLGQALTLFTQAKQLAERE